MKYGIDYLARLKAAVEDFEKAFDAWMSTQVEYDHSDSRGLLPTVRPKEEADERQVRRLELAVAETAGAAAKAVAVTGVYLTVQGIGPVDPIANWSMMSNPRAFMSPRELRTMVAHIKGRLTALLTEAEASDRNEIPAFSPAQLHPVIWSAASNQWSVHEYRVAVREAAEALNQHWKAKLNRHDVDDTCFWQETLSAGDPAPGKPKLAWPGDKTDKTVKSMRGGLGPLAKALTNLATGLNLTVRNVTTHTRDELPEQQAMERLSAYSYLARMLDACEVRRFDVHDSPSGTEGNDGSPGV